MWFQFDLLEIAELAAIFSKLSNHLQDTVGLITSSLSLSSDGHHFKRLLSLLSLHAISITKSFIINLVVCYNSKTSAVYTQRQRFICLTTIHLLNGHHYIKTYPTDYLHQCSSPSYSSWRSQGLLPETWLESLPLSQVSCTGTVQCPQLLSSHYIFEIINRLLLYDTILFTIVTWLISVLHHITPVWCFKPPTLTLLF